MAKIVICKFFFDKNLMFFVKTRICFFRSPIIENFPKGINFG